MPLGGCMYSIDSDVSIVEKNSNLAKRKGEENKYWLRRDRFFKVANKWYFFTRENREVGPFNNRVEAAYGLELFIDCIDNQNKSIDYANSIALVSGFFH